MIELAICKIAQCEACGSDEKEHERKKKLLFIENGPISKEFHFPTVTGKRLNFSKRKIYFDPP